jgi:hypothetical protein
LEKRIDQGRGITPADIVLKGGRATNEDREIQCAA